VLDVESTPTESRLSFAMIGRLGFLLLSLLLIGLILFRYFDFNVDKAIYKPNKIVDNSVDKPYRTVDKSYIKEHFQFARWYSLIETIEAQENQLVIKTYIFPDQEGRGVANEIVQDMRQQGISGDISVYGRDIAYFLLAEER
jgi:hypothetical protein